MSYYDPEIEERIKIARAKAARLTSNGWETEAEYGLALIIIIDSVLQKGIFDQYYRDRTLDQLVFEAEVVRGSKLAPEEKAAAVIATATKEDQADLSRHMAAEFGDTIDENFLKDAMEFMVSSEFKQPNQKENENGG